MAGGEAVDRIARLVEWLNGSEFEDECCVAHVAFCVLHCNSSATVLTTDSRQ